MNHTLVVAIQIPPHVIAQGGGQIAIEGFWTDGQEKIECGDRATMLKALEMARVAVLSGAPLAPPRLVLVRGQNGA